MTPDPPSLEREFRMMMSRHGIEVPPDLFRGALAGYTAMKGMTKVLRQRREPSDEPSNVYVIDPTPAPSVTTSR